MQIHEITLKEAAPRVPVNTGLAARAQNRNAPVSAPRVPQATQPATTAATPDEIEMDRRRRQVAQIPGAGPTTQALAGYIANKIGPRGLPSSKPAPATQAQLDAEMTRIKNQFPGLTDQQYQQALQQRAAKMTAPVAAPQAKPATAQPAVAKPTPNIQGGSELQKAQAAGSPARLAVGDNRSELQIAAEPNSIAQRQLATEPNKPAVAGAPLAPAEKAQDPMSQKQTTLATTKTFPPITIGAGPKATVYVNKGNGYVDNKSGKPIPPSILKAMGPQ